MLRPDLDGNHLEHLGDRPVVAETSSRSGDAAETAEIVRAAPETPLGVGVGQLDTDANGAPAEERLVGRLRAALNGPASLAIAGVVVNGGSLLMNLVLARALDAEAYGAVIIQTGIFMILSMAGSALQMAVVHRETATEHGDTRRVRWTWVRRLRGIGAFGVLAAAGVGLAVCGPVAMMLSYPHPIAIAEAVVAAALWVSVSIERGLLQARGAYGALAGNLAFESCVRITAVIGLVALDFGVNGAGLGLVIGNLIGAEHARRASGRTPHRFAPAPTRAHANARLPPAQRDERFVATTGPLPVLASAPARPGLRKNTLTALGALVPLALLQNMDVVIVGWLKPSNAGAYAAISTACKVPVFFGVAVANFLLPEAARSLRAGVPARGVLMTALAFVVTPGLLLTAVGMIGGETLLALVFGPHLTAGAPALWVLSLAMTSLAVTLMFTTYLLGAGEHRVVGVLAVGAVLTMVGLATAKGELLRTSTAALACQAVTAALVGTMVLLLHRRAAAEASAAGAHDAEVPHHGGQLRRSGQLRNADDHDGTGGADSLQETGSSHSVGMPTAPSLRDPRPPDARRPGHLGDDPVAARA